MLNSSFGDSNVDVETGECQDTGECGENGACGETGDRSEYGDLVIVESLVLDQRFNLKRSDCEN